MIKRTIRGAVGFALLQFIAIAIIPSHSFAQTTFVQVRNAALSSVYTIPESASSGRVVEGLTIHLTDMSTLRAFKPVTWEVTGAGGFFDFMDAGLEVSGDLIVLTLAVAGGLNHRTTPEYTVTVSGEAEVSGTTLSASQEFTINVLPVISIRLRLFLEGPLQ